MSCKTSSVVMLAMATLVSTVCLCHAHSRAIHPITRDSATPTNGATVDVNPPALLWPAVRTSGVSYKVEFSPNSSFPPRDTLCSDALKWAMFNPHKALDSGTWYWRYSVYVKGKLQKQSQTYRFTVPSVARSFVTPKGEQMLNSCPSSHPRVLITADKLPSLRRRAASSAEASSIVRTADKYFGAQLPSENAGKPSYKGANSQQGKAFAKWASKGLGNRLSASASALSQAYLITGEKKYGREAIRHALHVAGWDPKGVTGYTTSDFAFGACLRAMTLPYDCCFDLLTEDEKLTLRGAIESRASESFERWRNNLETKVFSAHIWQHLLHEFAEAAFATIGEIEDADMWASYIYELWLNRVPLLGGEDGGWANGNNYFATNFKTMIEIPAFFERLTGVDFFTHPWYRNTIKYMLYTWPPGSNCDGFGDGVDRRSLAPLSRLAFTDILSRRFDDPAGAWYVRSSLAHSNSTMKQDSSFRWHRLLETGTKDPQPPTKLDLPQARLFKDIGVVSMHTTLEDTPTNLMLAFRSSPYGSFNHAHADHNSFNVLYGGKPLFYTSGYYIGYGDDHFNGWYKHTRGHNSILIDDKGQASGSTEAYGHVSRYLHGDRISYCSGNASGAYPGTGLSGFTRHIALLRPSIIIVYDELEADHPARWSWLLHSPEKMACNDDGAYLLARTQTAHSRVDVFGSVPLNCRVHNRFDPPALNWRKAKKDGKLIEYADQWHAVADSSLKTRKMRYLAIIQVVSTESSQNLQRPEVMHGAFKVGAWTIDAQLDTDRPPLLAIRSADGKCSLDVESEHSVLTDSSSGEEIAIEAVDKAPTL